MNSEWLCKAKAMKEKGSNLKNWAGNNFCFRRMILDALLRKYSRGTRVEVRRSVRGYLTTQMQMMVVWTKEIVVEVVTNSWILDTFCKLCQHDFMRKQV